MPGPKNNAKAGRISTGKGKRTRDSKGGKQSFLPGQDAKGSVPEGADCSDGHTRRGGAQISPPKPDLLLEKVPRSEAIIAWQWELLRQVASRPAYAEWIERRSQADQGQFRFNPHGFQWVNVIREGTKAFDSAFGDLEFLVFDGRIFPSQRGPWSQLPKAKQDFFRSLKKRHPKQTVEIHSPGRLMQDAVVSRFSTGKWANSPPPFSAQLDRFLGESNADASAAVFFIIVDPDASIKQAKDALAKAIHKGRLESKAYTRESQTALRLLRGLNFLRVDVEFRARGQKTTHKGALVPDLIKLTGLSRSGEKIFNELRNEALACVKLVEAALQSVIPDAR